MLVYFNKKGIVKEQFDDYGNLPRVNTQYFKILACFDGIDLNSTSAYIRLQKPDFEGTEYPALFMKLVNMTYDASLSESSSNYFHNGNIYPCYLFDFASVRDGNQNPVNLLDVPGLWKATITVVDTNTNAANVVGLLTFNVGGYAESEAETVIEATDLANQWADQLSAKLGNINPYYMRVCSDFVSKATNGTLPNAYFNVTGIVVYDPNEDKFYKITSASAADPNHPENCYAAFTEIIPSEIKVEDQIHFLNDGIVSSDGDLTVNVEGSVNIESPAYFNNQAFIDDEPIATKDYVDAQDSTKVNKAGAGSYNRVYGVRMNGNDTTYNLNPDAATAGSIPQRRYNGHIYAGDLGATFNENDAVHKHYVDSQINTTKDYVDDQDDAIKNYVDTQDNSLKTYVDTQDGKKLDKVTTTSVTALRLYAVSSAGNQQMLNVGENASDIPQRKYNKQINVPLIPSSPDDAASKSYVDSKFSALGSALIYKGTKTVASINALQTSSLSTGDVYNVSDNGTLTQGNVQVSAGDNVAWDGSKWDKLSSDIDLSAYYNKTETDDLLDEKQDALVSGTNIKTINNQSLLGSGNITLDYLTTDDFATDADILALFNQGE